MFERQVFGLVFCYRFHYNKNQLTIKDVFKIDNFYELAEQNKNSNFECQLMYKQKMTTCTMNI